MYKRTGANTDQQPLYTAEVVSAYVVDVHGCRRSMTVIRKQHIYCHAGNLCIASA